MVPYSPPPRSRSYTSRRARPGEADGVDYNFVSRDRFEAMIAGGQFLEWAEYAGNCYGTAVVDTERELESGTDLVLVIEVQGARQVRKHRHASVLVFLLPPSAEALETRLRTRGEDSEEQIQRRLQVAREELRAVPEYDYVVVNDDLDACVDRLRGIVLAEWAATYWSWVSPVASAWKSTSIATPVRTSTMRTAGSPFSPSYRTPHLFVTCTARN